MDSSTPPKAPTQPYPSPPSIPSWLFLTAETGSTSHLEGSAHTTTQADVDGLGTGYGGRSHVPSEASTFMIHRLYDTDNDDNGADPLEPEHQGCLSGMSSSPCSSNYDDTAPKISLCEDIRFPGATIRLVSPANTSVSVDSLSFTEKPTLPRIRTSMASDCKWICIVESGPSIGSPPPPFNVSPLSRDSEPRRNGEDQPNALGQHESELLNYLACHSILKVFDIM